MGVDEWAGWCRMKYLYAILIDGEWIDDHPSDKVLTERDRDYIATCHNRLRGGTCKLVRVQTARDLKH